MAVLFLSGTGYIMVHLERLLGRTAMSAQVAEEHVDLWEFDGVSNWYRDLPPNTVDALFSEEHTMLRISQEADGFWMAQGGVQGEDKFASLEDAKKAGDSIIAAAYGAQEKAILIDAGLDPELWGFEYKDPATFTCKNDVALSITDQGDCRNGIRGTAWNGEDEIGEYAKPLQAAEALLQRPVLGL